MEKAEHNPETLKWENTSLAEANQHLPDVIRRLQEETNQFQQGLDATRTRLQTELDAEKQKFRRLAQLMMLSLTGVGGQP